MEENKDITSAEQSLPEPDVTEQAPAEDVTEQAPAEEASTCEAPDGETPATEQACDEACGEELNGEEVTVGENEGAEPDPEEPAVVPWDFGAECAPREKSKGKGAFFGVFSAVLAVCLALTIALMFLGENGFHIIKTIEIFRTVYTGENGEDGELLSAQEAADLVAKSTVTILSYVASQAEDGVVYSTAIGSGFVYDSEGHIPQKSAAKRYW